MPEATNDIAAAAPPTLDHLTGNPSVRERIKIALEAAWADGVRFPHALLCGPPGTGKSLTANIIAREMGSKVRELLAQNLFSSGELAAALLDSQDRDVVFIDEIHELAPHNQTLLYRAMEEGKLFLRAAGTSRAPRVLPLSNVTILAATTDEWALNGPLLQRFRMVLRFSTYSIEELTELLRQRVRALHWEVDAPALTMISQRAKGTPRIALRLAESCWRTARSQGKTSITAEDVERTCRMEELDPLGLDGLEQRLLRILAEASGPVRLNVLASRLTVPTRTISVLERYLIAEGLILKHSDGRELTQMGREHVQRHYST